MNSICFDQTHFKLMIFSLLIPGEAQVRVAVEVAEQFVALTGKSAEFTRYDGVVNRKVLTKYF